MSIYTEEQVYKSTIEYFGRDELAARVFVDKYCLKDRDGNFLELTPDDMHRRMAKEFARIEKKFGGKNQLSEEEIYGWLKGFDFIVPQGSVMYGLGNDYSYNSLSNCTVIESPEDSISSIMDTGRDMANLFKMRCGVGVDISPLRPDGSYVNNSARTSTGAWSFVNYYSGLINVIGQKGRRGAGMVTLRINHPDAILFATSKKDLSVSTGVNISFRVFDDFMEAVLAGEKYLLYWDDGKNRYENEVDAKGLWDVLIKSATESAEPGILYWDRHLEYNPSSSYAELRPKTTNPCAELPLSSHDMCRLISCNISNLVKNEFSKRAKIDYPKLKEMYYVAVRLGDDLVELELEKIERIMNKAKEENDSGVYSLWEKFYNKAKAGRRIGTGVHGLADLLSSICVRYGSEESIKEVDSVFKTIRDSAYLTSIELAEERGAFELFDWEKEKNNKFISGLPKNIKDKLSCSGRRNVCLLACAPTGSVSIESQSSSGIEPLWRCSYKRRRKVDKDKVQTKDNIFVSEDGQFFEEYVVYHPLVEKWNSLNPGKDLPEYFVEAKDIDSMGRVRIQGTIQRYVDNSISSTLNLPKGTTTDEVASLYIEGWKQGLKGLTVYVDGSREGVLVDTEEKQFDYHNPIKRPDTLPCDIIRMRVQNQQWVALVGLLDERPYEVFAGRESTVSFPRKYDRGHIVKRPYKTKPSEYDLILNKGTEDEFIIRNIVETFSNEAESVIGRLISLSLRTGARPALLSEQLLRDPSEDFMSYYKLLGRLFKKYIQNGEVPESGKFCQECGGELAYLEGCKSCLSCGYSKCS